MALSHVAHFRTGRRLAFPLIGAFSLAGGAPLLSGETLHAQGVPTIARTVAVWTAVGQNQRLEARGTKTTDRDLYMAGVRTRWLIHDGPTIDIAYSTDLAPLVISTGMPDYVDSPLPCPPGAGECVVPLALIQTMKTETVYGAGIVPVGFDATFRVASRVGLGFRASAGVVYFTRSAPDPEGRRLNFVFDIGPTAEFRIARRVLLTTGYRVNHISNGGSARANPGMNSRMLEIGLALAR